MKSLILNADDFAFNAAVSRGIISLARQGRLTATSAMTLSPRWVKDAPALAELRGQIDVGLHLDWTSMFAASAGHGKSLPKAMLRAVLGGFDQSKASVAIERQLDAFEHVWKSPPSHIDGHQHVQQFAGIREALADVMSKRYIGTKPYLRISESKVGSVDLKTKIIAGLGANAIKSIAANAMITTANGLFGIYNFKGDATYYAQLMQSWLSTAPQGAIIMCHPAQGLADVGDAADDIEAARRWEFEYLASEGFMRELVSYSVTLRSPPS